MNHDEPAMICNFGASHAVQTLVSRGRGLVLNKDLEEKRDCKIINHTLHIPYQSQKKDQKKTNECRMPQHLNEQKCHISGRCPRTLDLEHGGVFLLV